MAPRLSADRQGTALGVGDEGEVEALLELGGVAEVGLAVLAGRSAMTKRSSLRGVGRQGWGPGLGVDVGAEASLEGGVQVVGLRFSARPYRRGP